jgi:hypothetical protein
MTGVLFLIILTGAKGPGCFPCCESINDGGCFSVTVWSCLRCAAFIVVLKSVAGNTLCWRWERGVDCNGCCDSVTGDVGLVLLSGRDSGVSRASSDDRWPTGDGLSCISQSNLMDNIIEVITCNYNKQIQAITNYSNCVNTNMLYCRFATTSIIYFSSNRGLIIERK